MFIMNGTYYFQEVHRQLHDVRCQWRVPNNGKENLMTFLFTPILFVARSIAHNLDHNCSHVLFCENRAGIYFVPSSVNTFD